MPNYKHCCVIDTNGKFTNFVLVHIKGEKQEVQNYSLKHGESLVDANCPTMRPHAGAEGFISPAWGGEAWIESATDAEIAVWEKNNPAPEPSESEPTQLDILEAQVTYTAMMTDTLLGG